MMEKLPFYSRLIADVGISMGDEGKGRLIPEVITDLREWTGRSDPVAIVLKVNGGANSGHTCGGLKLNLYPAGVIDRSVSCLAIGAGVVADPRKFLWEARYIEHAGYEVWPRLLIDQRTMMSDLSHRVLDLAWENYRTNVICSQPRGSTGRGISPAYTEETAHFQLYYQEFLGSRDRFAARLRERLQRAEATIRYVCQATEADWEGFFTRLSEAEIKANAVTIQAGLWEEGEFDFTRFRGRQPFTFNHDLLVETYWQAGQRLADRIGDVREAVLRALREDRYVLGEFGQSYWLDKRTGFSPNQTASHTYVPEFFQSAGIPVQRVHTIGVCKAYDTKVGTHTYISRMPDDHPLCIKLKKMEFGVATGRQRMVGWFDAVEKGDALRYGGFDDWMINKLDALGFGEGWCGDLYICVAYRDEAGLLYRHVPRDAVLHQKLRPVFVSYPGWAEDIRPIRHFAQLPENARRYVRAMAAHVFAVAYADGAWPRQLPPLRYLGVGPDPDQVIRDVPAFTKEDLAEFLQQDQTARL